MHGSQHEADTGLANDVPLSPLSFLHRVAEVSGDDTGVRTDAGEDVSWSRLLDRAQRLAGRLAELGLGVGDRVAVRGMLGT